MIFVDLPCERNRALDKIEPKQSHVEFLPTISGQSMHAAKNKMEFNECLDGD